MRKPISKTNTDDRTLFGLGGILVGAALADRFLGLYWLGDLGRLLLLAAGAGLLYLGYRLRQRGRSGSKPNGRTRE